MTTPRVATLTPLEASRALYIDFEGLAKQSPALLGVRWSDDECGHFHQYVLGPDLAATAERAPTREARWPLDYPHAAGTPVAPKYFASSLECAIAALTMRSEAEDRMLVSWSRHELVIVQTYIKDNPALVGRFTCRWRDGKLTSKRWKTRVHSDVVFQRDPFRGRHRLEEYTALIGYTGPAYLGQQQAAKRLRDVRDQLKTRGHYKRLTRIAKGKWTKLLEYNWHDCNGLREVVLRAATALA